MPIAIRTLGFLNLLLLLAIILGVFLSGKFLGIITSATILLLIAIPIVVIVLLGLIYSISFLKNKSDKIGTIDKILIWTPIINAALLFLVVISFFL